jgi:hypothetical protein
MLALAQRNAMIWAAIAAAAAVSGALWLMLTEFASIQMFLVAIMFLAVWQFTIAGQWPSVPST